MSAPLSPGGTVRELLLSRDAASDGSRPPAHHEGSIQALGALFGRLRAAAAQHDLGEEEVTLAEELLRSAAFLDLRQKQALAFLLLASLAGARQGSTRVPLAGEDRWLERFVGGALAAAGLEVSRAALLREMRLFAGAATSQVALSGHIDRLVGSPGDPRPLIVEDGWLYQHRVREQEVRLAGHLARRLRAGAGGPLAIEPILEELRRRPERRGDRDLELSEEQRQAVKVGLEGRLALISGGPGTGKTAALTSLCRALAALGVPPSRIALAAPTGKAAQRMAESLRAGLDSIADPSAHDRALREAPPEPRTLHRLLGYLPASGRFRHHEGEPVAADAVIVDEASMIDLALFERLLAAVPESARLILLGDTDQLPSVEAGAVFRDLLEAAGHGELGFAARLTRSYRVESAETGGKQIPGASLLEAAAAIREGDARPLLGGGFLSDETPLALALRWYREKIAGAPGYGRLAGRVYRREDSGISEEGRADLDALFRLHARAKLLTATRRLAAGCADVNRRLHELTLAGATASGRPDFYPGEPIIARRNDYERGLQNGDPGVVVRVEEEGGRHHFRAVFRRGDSYAVFPLEALRGGIELAFAITVHQSQGSEYEEVALLLPPDDLPLLTRELLYTAVTRARRRVLIAGPRNLVSAAVRRPARRFSGLADRMGPGPQAVGSITSRKANFSKSESAV